MTCTTCQAPSEMYLCPQCARDLDAWLTRGRDLLPELDTTIHRQDVTRKPGNEGANGTRTQGSAAPMNIDAWQVREDLRVDLGMSAGDYARDPWSAGEMERVIENIRKAETLVLGKAETWMATCKCGAVVTSELDSATCLACGSNNTAAHLRADKARKIGGELLDTKELAAWLCAYTKHHITESQIQVWAARNKITPAQTNPRKYDPLAVVIQRALY